MLKRQRPVSPSPSIPDIPLYTTDSISFDYDMGRDVKRRRTVAPVLDGQLRGWNIQEPEDSWEEDEEDVDIVLQDNAYEVGKDEQQADARPGNEYKSANSLLHELHTSQQRKLMFSSFSPSPSPHIRTRFSDTSPQLPGLNNTLTKSILPSFSDDSRGQIYHGNDSKEAIVHSLPYIGAQANINEVQCVRERYEDTNKLLGSLFLSRRRELMSSSSPSHSR